MSDSEQFSNRFELDLISLLVNFSCELGQIMTIHLTSHGLDEWFRAMFEPTWTWPNFMFGQLFHVDRGKLWPDMTSYRLYEWLRAMFGPTWTLPNFTFGQLFMWIGANNDQIWLPMARWVILHDSFSDCFNIFAQRCSLTRRIYICRVNMAYMGKLGQLRVNITK